MTYPARVAQCSSFGLIRSCNKLSNGLFVRPAVLVDAEVRYFIVACTVITEVPEAVGP